MCQTLSSHTNKVSRNCLIHTKWPMRLCNSFINVGNSISPMTQTYSGSALNPSLFTMHPRNFASDGWKVHFFGFSLSPNLRRAVKSCSNADIYSSNVLVWGRLSSMLEDMLS